MTTPQAVAAPARTIRLIHTAMVTGVLLFAAVAHFVMKPSLAAPGALSPLVLRALVTLALALCGVSLVLRRRVPKRSTSETADLFWATAATPALLMWAVVEGACLLSIVLYAFTGDSLPVDAAVVGIVTFIVLNPGYLARA